MPDHVSVFTYKVHAYVPDHVTVFMNELCALFVIYTFIFVNILYIYEKAAVRIPYCFLSKNIHL